MRLDREMAVEAMRNMGWVATREKTSNHPRWVFSRPDTGGLYDTIRVAQADLSMLWVAEIAMRYDDAPELNREVQEAKERWLRSRFVGILSRADTP